MSYAGFWKRFAAYLIDAVILWVVNLFLLVPFLGMLGLGFIESSMMDGDPSEGMIAAIIGAYFGSMMMIFLAGWLYFAIMESSNKQGTLGKMALGIVVTDMNGSRISFGRATGRYFGKILSGLTFTIGYIIAGFTEKKQALHDMIAGCLVVNKQ